MTSTAQFQKAASLVQGLPKDGPVKIGQDVQLKFYAWFKQATVGDAPATNPAGYLDFTGKAKWKAWDEVRGKTKEEAEVEYVKLFKETVAQDTTEGPNLIKQVDEAA